MTLSFDAFEAYGATLRVHRDMMVFGKPERAWVLCCGCASTEEAEFMAKALNEALARVKKA